MTEQIELSRYDRQRFDELNSHLQKISESLQRIENAL